MLAHDDARQPTFDGLPRFSGLRDRGLTTNPHAELDESDLAESPHLPGDDLSDAYLSIPVVPVQPDEFTCSRCFLVQHRNRLGQADSEPICADCY
ncbi:DUF4193 family protein [Mycobacterium syngnathidarum]